MSNIISKIRQRIALREKNKFNLSCDHFTTNDFMKLTCSYIKEMVPGESINIKQTCFTRLAPMVKPMYGRCRVENRAFFVPMRTLMRGWNEFITDTAYEGSFVNVPTIHLHNLAAMFANSIYSTTVSSSTVAYDFKTGIGDTATKYKFTSLGKTAWQILNQLGYKFPIGYWITTTSTTADGAYVSALPLLAFCKIYDDWYKSQAYADVTFYGLFDALNTSGLDDISKLVAVFQKITRVCYDKNDIFVSAWDRPVSPNNNLTSGVDWPDITNDKTSVGSSTSVGLRSGVQSRANAGSTVLSTPAVKGVSDGTLSTNSYIGNLTQYSIDALKALTDYVKRHQLAGGLAMDRMLARFGMKPSDAALKRSTYLGKNTVDVQIADVMATANGQDGNDQSSVLGQYAGKGVGMENGSFRYKTDEYGYIIITSTVIPAAGYVQGENKLVRHTGRLDFFTPEFDSLGVAAIARKELVATYNGYNSEENLLNTLTPAAALEGVFGYSSRYYEYKTAYDNLTGDFVCPSLNAGNDNTSVWHLNRMFVPQSVTINNVTHNLDFVSATDAGQYDRIFATTGSNDDGTTANKFDHFYTIHHFEIEDYAPMAQLFDDYKFDGGDKDVNIEINGTQLN